MTKFASKTSKVMVQEEINVQSLTENKDIQVGYSDSDIVIIDSIQKFAEINTAHVSMHAIVICVKGKVQGLMNGLPMELHENQVAIVPPNVMITSIMVSPDFNLKAMFFTNSILQSFLREKMNIWNEVMYVHRLHILTMLVHREGRRQSIQHRYHPVVAACCRARSLRETKRKAACEGNLLRLPHRQQSFSAFSRFAQ